MVTQHAPGFYWHVHHREVVEWCYSYEERLDYIRRKKPTDEIPIREKLFQPVRGELPSAFVEAETVYDKAGTARKEAWAAYIEAQAARLKAFEAHMPALLALHAEECGCNWTPERGVDFTQENPL